MAVKLPQTGGSFVQMPDGQVLTKAEHAEHQKSERNAKKAPRDTEKETE